jgi:hypothetical protein
MSSLRVYYDPKHDRWLVDSWMVLTAAQLQQAAQHTLKIQRQRLTNMPASDKRDVVVKSVAALEAGRIFHRPIPKTLEKEATVFASTVGTGKIITGA